MLLCFTFRSMYMVAEADGCHDTVDGLSRRKTHCGKGLLAVPAALGTSAGALQYGEAKDMLYGEGGQTAKV